MPPAVKESVPPALSFRFSMMVIAARVDTLSAMIESLKINGFRGLSDIHLDRLGKVNLFIGPNGSGKTSLLQAAFAFCVEADPRKALAMVPGEGLLVDPTALDQQLNWLFPHSNSSPSNTGKDRTLEASFSGNANGTHRRVELRLISNKLQSFQDIISRQHSTDRTHEMRPEASPDLSKLLSTSKKKLQLTTHHGAETNSGTAFFTSQGIIAESPEITVKLSSSLTAATEIIPSAINLDKVITSGRREQLLQLLQIFDPDIRDISIGVNTQNSPVIRVEHARLGIVPYFIMGGGFGAVLHFALNAGSAEFDHVMVDEFDSSLHVSLVRALAKFTKDVSDRGQQLFLTTHRGDTLDAFSRLVQEGWDGLQVFQMNRVKGQIRVRRFDGSELLSAWTELGLDLRVPL